MEPNPNKEATRPISTLAESHPTFASSISLANPWFAGIPTLPRLRPRLRSQRYTCSQKIADNMAIGAFARTGDYLLQPTAHFATRYIRPSLTMALRRTTLRACRRGTEKIITTRLWLLDRNLDRWPPTFLGWRPDRLSAGYVSPIEVRALALADFGAPCAATAPRPLAPALPALLCFLHSPFLSGRLVHTRLSASRSSSPFDRVDLLNFGLLLRSIRPPIALSSSSLARHVARSSRNLLQDGC